MLGIYWNSILVGCGVYLQSANLLIIANIPNAVRDTLGLLVGCFILMAISSVLSEKGSPMTCLWGTILFYILAYSMAYNKDILPVISENSLLVFNIIFLASILTFLPTYSHWSTLSTPEKIILDIIVFPSIIVLINAFLPYTTPRWLKLFFYVWYLIMATTVLIISVLHCFITMNPQNQHSFLSQITYLTVGMIMLNILVDVGNVLALIPITGKDETLSEELKRVSEHIDLLNSKYVDEECSYVKTLLTLITITGVLLLNHRLSKMDDQLAINIALLSSRFIFGTHRKAPQLNLKS